MYRLFQAWEVIVLASQRIALLNSEINLEKMQAPRRVYNSNLGGQVLPQKILPTKLCLVRKREIY